LVVLSERDEPSLARLAQSARAAGASVVEFREPDFGDALTAIALMGEPVRGLTSSLPLALRDHTIASDDCA